MNDIRLKVGSDSAGFSLERQKWVWLELSNNKGKDGVGIRLDVDDKGDIVVAVQWARGRKVKVFTPTKEKLFGEQIFENTDKERW